MKPPASVDLRCAGGYAGTVVAGRYFRTICRDRRCRHVSGANAVHWWDLSTGWMVNDPFGQQPDERDPASQPREAAQ